MDSITQATLGAAIGQALLGKKIGGKAAVLGAIVATIPDLDVVLLPLYDSLQRISIHRGFSHSILFSVLGALLLTYILTRIKWTKHLSVKRLFIFNWLALFTHILLDAFTAYGTQMFLPFSDYRVSFDSINIVDPVYTIPLIVGLGITVYHQLNNKKWSRANHIGLVVSSVYLLFTLVNKQFVANSIQSELVANHITYDEMKTIPVGVGNINWYGVAKNKDTLYIGKYSRFKNEAVDFHSFPINEQILEGLNPKLSERLKWFSQDFYTVAEQDGKVRLYNLQCDMQGVRAYGNYKAPTAFYFEVTPHSDGSYELTTGMHKKQ
ncbi:MAG: metal-dependent hydrolase [Bacteroidetes bacterium]|nr:metal-dependent hydrolase [Bacteroidota bacterium]